MKILKTRVLRGPNVWSNYRQKLIQLRLDLEEMEDFPTNKIPGFKERLEQMLPGIVEHTCSEGVRGGLLQRIERGTWLGHVLEHIALEIQTMAGMETGYGRTRETNDRGVYNVVFSYVVEEAGLYAAEAAFRITEALCSDKPYNIENDIEELTYLNKRYGLGPSTKSIVEEAEKRGIPWNQTIDSSTIQLGYGVNQKHIQATITSNTKAIAVDIASDKEDTKKLLKKFRIPIADGGTCSDEAGLFEIIADIAYPIVLKPLNANQGKGISIDVTDDASAKAAFALAKTYSNQVLVEKYIRGFDFRILVVDNKFVAAAKRVPANVIGDGKSTIAALIDKVNEDPQRGSGHENVLTRITVCADTETLLRKNHLTLNSIPALSEIVFLKSTANLSTGGTAIDVTDDVHPDNIFLAERIARAIGLDVCGIDIMATNLTEPIAKNGGVVLEVNAAPGFRMHLAPSEGKPRNVAAAVVDMLYPPSTPARIPIFAVTGTNGKTTTTRLLAHIAKKRGFHVGYTTTDGIYIGDHLIEEGDTTGPVSGNLILSDPTVDFAVLETARGGILRSGLCFSECDVAIITNIKEDHLGLNDIHTVRELANVKAVVARSARKDGWAVLNADDEHCVQIAKELDCNVAYFSMDENNLLLQEQVRRGLPAITYENGFITFLKQEGKDHVANVADIPLTDGGKCGFMIANAMGAAMAAYVWGFSVGEIGNALRTFIPSPEQTPGRLNLFEFHNFNVLVDYAHNPHGYTAIEEYLANVPAARKIGIISGVGDRRDEDIRECGTIAARMFDHIIIRQEQDLRGSSEQHINELLLDGIVGSGRKVSFDVIPNEVDAIKRALKIADTNDLVVALSDQYKSVTEVIKEELEKERSRDTVYMNLRKVS